MEEKDDIMNKLKEQVENKIKTVSATGLKNENIEQLYKLVDLHKDIVNEEYWKTKEEGENKDMRYGRNTYNEGRFSGGYEAGGYGESYGRRGVRGTGRGRYRGEELMEEMSFHYGNYSENPASGQFMGASEKMEALSNLMESAYEYFKELKESAKSPDEIKMMEHYFKKIGQI